MKKNKKRSQKKTAIHVDELMNDDWVTLTRMRDLAYQMSEPSDPNWMGQVLLEAFFALGYLERSSKDIPKTNTAKAKDRYFKRMAERAMVRFLKEAVGAIGRRTMALRVVSAIPTDSDQADDVATWSEYLDGKSLLPPWVMKTFTTTLGTRDCLLLEIMHLIGAPVIGMRSQPHELTVSRIARFCERLSLEEHPSTVFVDGVRNRHARKHGVESSAKKRGEKTVEKGRQHERRIQELLKSKKCKTRTEAKTAIANEEDCSEVTIDYRIKAYRRGKKNKK